MSGGWLIFGHEYHLGEVYLNDEAYCEKLHLNEVLAASGTWFTEGTETTTSIYANFGGINPNSSLAEINVRECIFFPIIKGLRYITIDGLSMVQAAANWVNFTDFQHAAVGTYYGKSWIIENCYISDAKCAGLVCGNNPSGYNEGFDMEETGHHIIRNNWICRCGEAGIHGYKGWVASLFEKNLIEDINTRKHFGGYETAGIKLHHAIDVIVRNNVVRRVYSGVGGQYAGIWIDWSAQGTRVTGNIIYDLNEWTGWAFFIQNSHCGPVLVDNNVFAGQIYNTSRNSVFVHNLFVDSRWYFMVENMDPVFWEPHSANVVDVLPLTHQENDRYFNNIFVKKGTDQLLNARDFKVGWNVYYQGARKAYWGEDNSIVNESFHADVQIQTLRNGVKILFLADDSPRNVLCPHITHDFIGIYQLTGQGLEDHDGNPIDIDIDILGNIRDTSHPLAGPLDHLESGENAIILKVGPTAVAYNDKS